LDYYYARTFIKTFEFGERYHPQYPENVFHLLQIENMAYLFHQNQDRINRNGDKFLKSTLHSQKIVETHNTTPLPE
jgi:hypothetical protein